MAKHTICNIVRSQGNDVTSALVNVKVRSDMENGSLIALNGPAADEVEAFEFVAPAEGAELHTLALLHEPEVMYPAELKLLSDFYIIAGEDGRVCRAYLLNHGDEYGFSEEAFEGAPAVGETVGCNGTYKFAVGGTGVGKIVAILNGLFVVRID